MLGNFGRTSWLFPPVMIDEDRAKVKIEDRATPKAAQCITRTMSNIVMRLLQLQAAVNATRVTSLSLHVGLFDASEIASTKLQSCQRMAHAGSNDRFERRTALTSTVHDPDFRQAEKDWYSFVEKLTERLVELDDTVPELPVKDVVCRRHHSEEVMT